MSKVKENFIAEEDLTEIFLLDFSNDSILNII
jgi:hypothetical protein